MKSLIALIIGLTLVSCYPAEDSGAGVRLPFCEHDKSEAFTGESRYGVWTLRELKLSNDSAVATFVCSTGKVGR